MLFQGPAHPDRPGRAQGVRAEVRGSVRQDPGREGVPGAVGRNEVSASFGLTVIFKIITNEFFYSKKVQQQVVQDRPAGL